MRDNFGAYTVENYGYDKFAHLVGFYDGLGRGGFGLSEKETRFLRVKLSRPGYDPEKDLFLLSDSNGVIAFFDTIPEPGIDRVVVNFQVRREDRFADAAGALMGPCLNRCSELKARRIHVCLDEEDHAGQLFFKNSGFTRVRTFFELKADLRERRESVDDPDLRMCASFAAGDDAYLQKLQNGIFSGSWGFCPNTVEEIEYYLALTATKIEDILLLREKDDLLGYSWAHESLASGDTLKTARIHMFGIKKKFRGRGLGRKLLNLSLDALQSLGFRTVELTVDAQNKPACALYAALGFRVQSRCLWFEKQLTRY
ncbi:MAG: GNAT family N-acetyltransferase [Candidatus Aminicenantes bacterium]|nr:GNAT family N-acetyltransferase [Candidatus Aminicenantes bacterium]